MNLQQALAKLRKQEFTTIYLVQGKEVYLSELFKTELMNQLVKTEDDLLNFSTFDMDQTSIQEAVSEAETLPFFGDYRLIFIENPSFLTSERKQNGIEHEVSYLLDYLENPSPTTILVITAKVGKLDERKKISKWLKKKAVLVETNPMQGKEVKEYVSQSIKNEGYTIQPNALDTLMELTDYSLSQVMGELQKLFLFSFDSKVIYLDSVKELVPKSLEHNVFDLTTEVLSGNSEEAIRLYEDLLLQGEETIKLNSILLNQIRLFLQAKILVTIGYQQATISDTLKVHPYRVKLALQRVRSFKLEQLEELFDELVENDYRMKTGKMDKKFLFELFILKLTNQLQRG